MSSFFQPNKNLESLRISYQSAREVIKERIMRKKPFSLVRIGDGESVVLDWKEGSHCQDLEDHMRLWFGNYKPRTEDLRQLRRLLTRAAENATFLGIPTRRQVTIHRRYQTSYEYLERLVEKQPLRQQHICDAAIHRYLHLSGDIIAFLKGSECLGLVTCRNVANQVQEVFQPLVMSHYILPEECSGRSVKQGALYSWLPKGFEKLLSRITIPYRGAPFLVGGGIMGKLICEFIRKKGGIAMDIGSIFDGWSSINTRGYFEKYPMSAYNLQYAAEIGAKDDPERLSSLIEITADYEQSADSLMIYDQ